MEHKARETITSKKKIVVKIGTSSLTFPNGRLNFQRIERLAEVLSTLQKNGKKIILVSSGAIAVGAGRIGLQKRPDDIASKQALAAIGQSELIRIYQKFFNRFEQNVAQVLLTKEGIDNPTRKSNAKNTIDSLLDMNIIPIVNENDTVATYEIEFGDNDTLSAYVARLIKADLLILLSDINGLYSSDPKTDTNAKIISVVDNITSEIESIAKGAGSNFAIGGMVTKISAAKLCCESNIDTVITNGKDPEIIYEILKGNNIGTLFMSNPQNN